MDRYALVSLVNAANDNNWILASVNRDTKKPAPKRPQRFPTPDKDTPSAPKPGSFAAMVVRAKRAARKRKESANG